jgi:uncharacterized membrane protein
MSARVNAPCLNPTSIDLYALVSSFNLTEKSPLVGILLVGFWFDKVVRASGNRPTINSRAMRKSLLLLYALSSEQLKPDRIQQENVYALDRLRSVIFEPEIRKNVQNII